MADTIDRAEAARLSHIAYLFGLGTGLGLSYDTQELHRLTKGLSVADQTEVKRGFLRGVALMHNSPKAITEQFV